MLRMFLFLGLILLTTAAAAPAEAQDKKGDPGAELVRFRPKQFTGKLTPYDLNKEYRENKENRDAGKPWIFSYILVKEFNDVSYPGVEFRWHETSDTFDHIGIREKDKDTVQTVFLGWGGGSIWVFYHGELERTTRADRFAIIPKAEVAAAIKKSLLDRKRIGGEKDVTDVFRYRMKNFEADLRDRNIKFRTVKFGPVTYGVSAGDKLYLFTEAGREADGSVALIDIQDKNVDRKGEPGAELVRFRPQRFAGPLTPYDLDKEYRENKKKDEAGQPSTDTYFIVKGFNDHYYPGGKFQWHLTRASDHIGNREKDKDTVQQVYLGWSSLSEGLSWGIYHGELERTTRADQFAIIPKAEVAAAIKKSLLDRKLIGGERDITGVFRYRVRTFVIDSKDIGVKFPKVEFGPVKYGVSVRGRVYLFTEAGREADGSVAMIDAQAPGDAAAGWEWSRPKRFTGKLKPYDLDKEYRENKKKDEAGQPSTDTYFIVKGFNDNYYPGGKFRWQMTHAGDHIGIREKDKDTVQEVHLGWSILSEGLLWIIYHGELERTTRADRFAIIPKAEVAAAIKKSLFDRKLIGDEKDVADVFRYRVRTFEIDSRKIGITFPKVEFRPAKYGVSVGEDVYLFTETGEPTK